MPPDSPTPYDMADRVNTSEDNADWSLLHEKGGVNIGLGGNEAYIRHENRQDTTVEVAMNMITTRYETIIEIQGDAQKKLIPANPYVQLVTLTTTQALALPNECNPTTQSLT